MKNHKNAESSLSVGVKMSSYDVECNWDDKSMWTEIAYEKKTSACSRGTVCSTAEIRGGMVPLQKGAIVGVYDGPLSAKDFHIQAIGVVTQSNKSRSTINVLMSFEPRIRTDEYKSYKNFQYVIASEKIAKSVTAYRLNRFNIPK